MQLDLKTKQIPKGVEAVLVPFMLLDNFFNRIWSGVLSFLCGMTGRSNFFFARLFGAIGGSLLCLTVALTLILDLQKGSILWVAFDLFLIVWVGALIKLVFEVAGKLEKALEAADLRLSLLAKYSETVVFVRILLTILALVRLLATGWLDAMIMAGFGGAFYFLLDFRPESKGRIRKLADSLVRQAKKLRIPAPMPVPGHAPP